MGDFCFYSSECVVLSFITPEAEIGLVTTVHMFSVYRSSFKGCNANVPLLSVLSTRPILAVFVLQRQGKMRHYQAKQEPVKSPLSSGERFVFPNVNVPATHLQLNSTSVHSDTFTALSRVSCCHPSMSGRYMHTCHRRLKKRRNLY